MRGLDCSADILKEKGFFVPSDLSACFLQVIFRDSCISTCAVGYWILCCRWRSRSWRGSASSL